MQGLLKKSDNGSTSSPQVGSAGLTTGSYHRFTTEEVSQIKMLDLRAMMKDKGVRLSWANGQYEGKCPFHEDKARAPRLMTNQKEGVWLWRCDGGHHGGTIIDFVMAREGIGCLKAMQVLRTKLRAEGYGLGAKEEKILMPKLNGNGATLGEILGPILGQTIDHRQQTTDKNEEKDEIATSADQDRPPRNDDQLLPTPNSQLPTVSEDEAVFTFGDCIYQAKDLKNASKNSLKIILKLIYKDGNFTDRVDLHSARARRSFANQAAERLSLQSAQVEEHLEALMEQLEEILRSSQDDKPRVTSHEPQEMPEEERSQVLELLRDPHLLDRMASDLDKLGYVGEPINKKLCYLVATSRLLDKPISCIIRSGSGAGKSALMEQALSLMPPEDVLLFSRITPQSLFYMGREALDRKILAIDEREGSQEADYSIRTLQSRGKLTLAASTKDPKTGQWKTFIREFSARTPYMESSTKERINEENLNRSFELYLDESPEQTRRILEAQRKAAAGLDILNEGEKVKLVRIYQNVQRLLEPVEVKIPYELEVSLPQSWIRTRRDHERFLSLVKVIVLLHQYQRKEEVKKNEILRSSQDDKSRVTSHEPRVIEARSEDIKIARALLEPILGDLSNDLPRPVGSFYELLKKKVQENANGIGIEDFAFTRRQVRGWTGLPDHLLKRHVKALEDLEYVQVKRSARGSRHYYWLVDGLGSGINTEQRPKVEQAQFGSNPHKI